MHEVKKNTEISTTKQQIKPQVIDVTKMTIPDNKQLLGGQPNNSATAAEIRAKQWLTFHVQNVRTSSLDEPQILENLITKVSNEALRKSILQTSEDGRINSIKELLIKSKSTNTPSSEELDVNNYIKTTKESLFSSFEDFNLCRFIKPSSIEDKEVREKFINEMMQIRELHNIKPGEHMVKCFLATSESDANQIINDVNSGIKTVNGYNFRKSDVEYLFQENNAAFDKLYKDASLEHIEENKKAKYLVVIEYSSDTDKFTSIPYGKEYGGEKDFDFPNLGNGYTASLELKPEFYDKKHPITIHDIFKIQKK